jgi:patatin-like phospholipase/acyl hydrolase
MTIKDKLNRRNVLRGAASAIVQVAATSAQLKADTLVSSSPIPKFKILSLDGGGARGYLTALILANVELYLNKATRTEKPLGQRFDFLVGTSTGGIIALGLATGRTAQDIAGFYEKLVPEVFAPSEQRYWTWSNPKYQSEKLRNALKAFFGDSTLENVQTDICITGVALRTGKPRFYKSLYQAVNIGRQKEKLVDIALGTSAAPTYFKAHNLAYSDGIIDGGICANNPSVVAIVDSIRFERPSISNNVKPNALSDLVMISVGTGEQPSMPYDAKDLAEAGLVQWAQHISDVMFESQSAVADTQARFLLPGSYLRINPKLGLPLLLDDIKHLNEFKNLSDINSGHAEFIEKYFLSPP